MSRWRLFWGIDDNIWGVNVNRSIELYAEMAKNVRRKWWFGSGDLVTVQHPRSGELLTQARRAYWNGDIRLAVRGYQRLIDAYPDCHFLGYKFGRELARSVGLTAPQFRALQIVAAKGANGAAGAAGAPGTPDSRLAWAVLAAGVCAAMKIEDAAAADCMRLLADGRYGDAPIVAGESAVAGLAGLLAVAGDEESRQTLQLGGDSRVLLFGTEGATDPENHARITGGG